jgi:tRNA threonylcarbamoyladenosine biosynthesis protein TsaB
MRVLAFDTSSSISAVAVTAGDRVLAEDHSAGSKHQGDVLLPRIAAVLAAAGVPLSAIELIAVGVGPGSFTGLRIGLATAKGLALATSIPIAGVCSLRVLARGVIDLRELAIPVLDAGKGELFGAVYARRGEALQTLLPPLRAQPDELAQRIASVAHGASVLCGGGARQHFQALRAALGADASLADIERDLPQARHLAREAVLRVACEGPSDLATLEPVYLRDSDAKLPSEPLRLG